MKRLLALLLIFALLCPALSALGEGETVTFQGKITVDVQTDYVDLKNVKAKSIGDLIKFLRKLPNLKKVDMFETPVHAKQIDQLVSAFPEVEFGWTMCIDCHNPHHPERKMHYIRTDAKVFSTLHNNQCTRHTSKDFEILKYCKDMLALDIGHNAVTSLGFVSAMPKLRVLIIGRNDVKDLSPLKNCPDLEYLEAFTNQIQSVEPLLSCPYLMDLNVPNNQIQDPELFAQMTSLKRLWAFNYAWRDTGKSRVPNSIKKLVKDALPNCKINWINAGTNDWREPHKHYAVIKEMFNTGKYIPFHDSH